MRRLLPALLAASLLATAPACSLLNQTAASAEEAADALRDAATALQLLDALAGGFADGTDLPTPEDLRTLADVVDSLTLAHGELAVARTEIKSGHVFDAAEALEASLGHMESAATSLEKLGVDVQKAKEALHQARLMLQHLRS